MDGLSILGRRFYWSLRRRGLAGTLGHTGRRIFRRKTPPWTRPEGEEAADQAFDREFSVETAGIVRLKNLSVADSSWVYGIDYEPISEGLFHAALGELDIPFEEFTFVDLGSGKGKALLLAAAYPFKQVIGVEIAADLNTAAETNIRRYTGPREAASITTLCMDAAKYEFPAGPLVIHAYNPFDDEIMAKVIGQIRKHQEFDTAPVYVALSYPRLGHMFTETGFVPLARGDSYIVLRSPNAAGVATRALS